MLLHLIVEIQNHYLKLEKFCNLLISNYQFFNSFDNNKGKRKILHKCFNNFHLNNNLYFSTLLYYIKIYKIKYFYKYTSYLEKNQLCCEFNDNSIDTSNVFFNDYLTDFIDYLCLNNKINYLIKYCLWELFDNGYQSDNLNWLDDVTKYILKFLIKNKNYHLLKTIVKKYFYKNLANNMQLFLIVFAKYKCPLMIDYIFKKNYLSYNKEINSNNYGYFICILTKFNKHLSKSNRNNFFIKLLDKFEINSYNLEFVNSIKLLLELDYYLIVENIIHSHVY